MILNKKQTKAIDLLEDNTHTEGVFGGAAGGGKSFLGSYYLLKQSLKYPNTRWLMGRAKLKTLKETTLKSFFEVASLQGIKTDTHFRFNNQTHSIQFFNGSEILLKDLFYYPSDPEFDELGSLEITGGFIDEVSQITRKAWQIVNSRIRYKLDENSLIPKLFGTCNPSKGFLYDEFYKPYRENTLEPYRFFIQSLVTDNPDISKHYVNNLHKLDEKSKQRLLYGNWDYDDDPTLLMDYEKCVDLFTNTHVSAGNKYMTIDVARLGKDKSVIMIWDGFRVIKILSYDTNRIDELANIVRGLQRQYSVPNSNTIADEDGVGGGVVDILRCKGFIGNERATGNYNNMRSECYFILSNKVNSNDIFINDTDNREQIVKELQYIKQVNFDKEQKLQVISKKDMPDSPDFADCLMMRMRFETKMKKRASIKYVKL